MRKIFWEGLGNCVEKVFVGRKGKFVSEFQNSRMTTLSVLDDSCSMLMTTLSVLDDSCSFF